MVTVTNSLYGKKGQIVIKTTAREDFHFRSLACKSNFYQNQN